MDPFLAFALVVTAVAAVIDWRTGEIPNWVSLGALAIAPVAHFAWGAKHATLTIAFTAAGMSVAGALACGLVPLFFFTKGATGGGDVKMFAAVGALLLPLVGIEAELYAFVLAALIVPVRLAWEGKLLRVLGNTAAIALNPFLPKSKRREIAPEAMTWVRFGPAIFAGVALSAIEHWSGR